MSTITENRWYTVAEVAESLGVTAGRVRQFLAEGRLSGEKFGHLWAINQSELERFRAIDRKPGNPDFKKLSK